jgi:long-chain fatty acid transport protein
MKTTIDAALNKTHVVTHHVILAAISSALACGALLPQSSQAGGIELYEIATPDVGLASAGYAARAQDASTLFKNPAGMSLLPGSQFQAGAQLTYGNVEFSPDASTTISGGNGGNAIGALPAAGLYFSQQLSERFAVGFGAFSYFGLVERYDDNWVGRYYMQKAALLGMTLMPAASFKATDWLSIGAGLNAMYGYMDTKVKIRTGAPGDGELSVDDQTWGFGANAGMLIEPIKGTRLGVTYLSPVKLDFKDTPSFSNLGPLGGAIFANPSELNLGLTVPQSVVLGVYHQLNAKWVLLADVGWQNWSQFGKVDVGVDSATPTSLTKNLNYEDTWHGAIGAQYRASEKWLLSSGFAYDTSAVSDANRTVSLPMGEAYRFGLGAQWQVSKAVSLGAAYEFMWGGNMPVTQDSAYRGRVSGSFENSWFSFFLLHLTWTF